MVKNINEARDIGRLDWLVVVVDQRGQIVVQRHLHMLHMAEVVR